MPDIKQSPLSLLKYPLVFFGMCISVVEAAFGFALNKSTSENLSIILSTWMGSLFLVSIFIVAFLVYKVPTHIMLESQKKIQNGIDKETNERLISLELDVEALKTKKDYSNKKLISGLKDIISTIEIEG